MEGSCKMTRKSGGKQTILSQCTALQKEAGGLQGLCMQNGPSRAGSEQEGEQRYDVLEQKYITAETKREIKSGYKDARGTACGKTCCFGNGTTANESHFTIIFCPGLVPAGF